MADIAERLRLYAQQFEDQHAPEQITLAMRAGADEIERKKAEIASLLRLLADARTESMRLRAALRPFADALKGYWSMQPGSMKIVAGPWASDLRLELTLVHFRNASYALEEGMTSPDEREDCTGLEDSSTANPCGREDCEEEGRT